MVPGWSSGNDNEGLANVDHVREGARFHLPDMQNVSLSSFTMDGRPIILYVVSYRLAYDGIRGVFS